MSTKFNLLTVFTVTCISLVSATSVRFPALDLNVKPRAASIANLFSAANHYGSPVPAWEEGYAGPQWYFGDNPDNAPGLVWLKDRAVCNVLNKTPNALHCPTFPLSLQARAIFNARVADTKIPTPVRRTDTGPSQVPPPPSKPGVYDPTFSGLSGAINADGYLTFGLVDTVHDCEVMCDSVPECSFVNTYHDVNGKNGSPLLTCSLYNGCQDASYATNTGGQSQPDGSLNYITNSDGWCKRP